MYHELLDDWQRIAELLEEYPVVGTHRRCGCFREYPTSGQCHRCLPSRPFKPADFHPGTRRTPQTQEPTPKVDITVLKTVFVNRGPFPRGDH